MFEVSQEFRILLYAKFIVENECHNMQSPYIDIIYEYF